MVSSAIEAIGLLCGREVASDVLKQVRNSPKRSVKFEHSDVVLAKVESPAYLEIRKLESGGEQSLNLCDSTLDLH